MTLDYGADVEALLWQQVLWPEHEGIHVVNDDRRSSARCATASPLECLGLRDLSTSVDFTEVAEAGKTLGGWTVSAYGPAFLLELSFGELSPRFGHLFERAGGISTAGMLAWYREPAIDHWASLKVMVQHRGSRGRNWTTGSAFRDAWSLLALPIGEAIPPAAACRHGDLWNPPGTTALLAKWDGAFDTQAPQVRQWHAGRSPLEGSAVRKADLAQRRGFAELHLAALLLDYYWELQLGRGRCSVGTPEAESELQDLALRKGLLQMYGQPSLDRVVHDVGAVLHSVVPLRQDTQYSPHICLAAGAFRMLRRHCGKQHASDQGLNLVMAQVFLKACLQIRQSKAKAQTR